MMQEGTRLDHAAIAARVPHAGPMCLLDEVVAWDARHIECRAFARPRAGIDEADGPAPDHGATAHPLAHDGRLPATAAIEYAAQAMALHGRLMRERAADVAPTRGFLAGLRSIRLHCRWIETAAAPLTVRVERYAGDEVQVLYDFEVLADRPIAQGRAVVVLDAGARTAAAAQPAASAPGGEPRR